MSGFGFEQPSAQPVNPRRVGFDLMQRAQEQTTPGDPPAPPVRHRPEAAVGAGLTDRDRVQGPDISQPAKQPDPGRPLNLNNPSTRAAVEAVLDRVMAPELKNTEPTTDASIAQVRSMGLSEDELQLMRQAGIL